MVHKVHGIWKECVFCCSWLEFSTNVIEIKLVDSVVHVLTSLLIFYLFYQLLRKKCWTLLWLWVCPFLFSVQSVLASCNSKLCYEIYTHLSLLYLLIEVTPSSLDNVSFNSQNSCSKSYTDINVAICLLMSVCLVYISHSCTCNLFLSYLQCISYRKRIVVSWVSSNRKISVLTC